MVELYIDGEKTIVDKNSTLMQACTQSGKQIPRFCYHDRLSIAGNCRICLVEVENSPKPVVSCAQPVMPGMKIRTESPLVKQYREGVMEFLLSHHPLDCPICDQGGECDLQDQAVLYGKDRSRYFGAKRGVHDKDLGPFIKTIMTRCIHCTRCVRFVEDIISDDQLVTLGRGADTEIGTYTQKVLQSELSGNIIDLCPVGALTSKPYAFKARPWELKTVNSIDIMDAFGSHIQISRRGGDIMRILPKLNNDLNEEWITDKIRFSYDGFTKQRLTSPFLKRNDSFVAVTWQEAFKTFKQKLNQSSNPSITLGPQVDAESALMAKLLWNSLNKETVNSSNSLDRSSISNQYYFNTPLESLQSKKICILVGTNPRTEAPLLNIKLKKGTQKTNMKVYSVGAPSELTFKHTSLGTKISDFISLVQGHSILCQEILKEKGKVSIILGSDTLKNPTTASILLDSLDSLVTKKIIQVSDINTLHHNAASPGLCDIGILNTPTKQSSDFVYSIGEEELNLSEKSNAFIVYQGHHGDKGANRANLIFPSVPFTEKSSTYLNIEGRTQRTNSIGNYIQESREDWKILHALGEYLHTETPSFLKVSPLFSVVEKNSFNTLLKTYSPTTGVLDILPKRTSGLFQDMPTNAQTTYSDKPLKRSVVSYYQTNPILRASVLMSLGVKKNNQSNYY